MTLALANKESLVAAGELAVAARQAGRRAAAPGRQRALGAPPVPRGPRPGDRRRPRAHGLRQARSAAATRADLADVTPADALAHPTWSMGPKITVDSATLANKGLELIEAHWLFDVPYERIEVVVHPTLDRPRARASPRRSAARARRAARTCASRSRTRSPTPSGPRRPFRQLDLEGLELSFEAPDTRRVPAAARSRARRGSGAAPRRARYNAANEVAVEAFLDGRIGFLDIAAVVEETLAAVDGAPARDLDDLVAADAEARRLAARGLQPA